MSTLLELAKFSDAVYGNSAAPASALPVHGEELRIRGSGHKRLKNSSQASWHKAVS